LRLRDSLRIIVDQTITLNGNFGTGGISVKSIIVKSANNIKDVKKYIYANKINDKYIYYMFHRNQNITTQLMSLDNQNLAKYS